LIKLEIENLTKPYLQNVIEARAKRGDLQIQARAKHDKTPFMEV